MKIFKTVQTFFKGSKRRIAVISGLIAQIPGIGQTVKVGCLIASVIFGGSDLAGLANEKLKKK